VSSIQSAGIGTDGRIGKVQIDVCALASVNGKMVGNLARTRLHDKKNTCHSHFVASDESDVALEPSASCMPRDITHPRLSLLMLQGIFDFVLAKKKWPNPSFKISFSQ
jgi:hypothetical protein